MDYSSIGATNQAKTTPNPARVAKLVEMNEPIQTQPAEVKLRKSAASETSAGDGTSDEARVQGEGGTGISNDLRTTSFKTSKTE